MDEFVEESFNETENLDVNPENPTYSTNWCDIPMEMRMECIKWMNFKTRTRLGATSHTEKSLVEAKKYHFDTVKMTYFDERRGEHFNLTVEDIHVESVINLKKTLNCFEKIVKAGRIDTIEYTVPYLWQLGKATDTKRFKDFGPIRCKTFKYWGRHPMGSRRLLRFCQGVETIFLYNRYDSLEARDVYHLFNTPTIFNARHIQIDGFKQLSGDFAQIIQKWIDNNAEVGKSLRFAEDPWALCSFDYNLKNRVVYQNDDEVRIRTDDESKHILISCVKKSQSKRFFSCTIIPSNLLESEYENDDQWVDDMEHENKNNPILHLKRDRSYAM